MRFDVLTLFPAMFEGVLGESMIARARKNGHIELNYVNIRDFSKSKHKNVDDYAYGGGTGMVMGVQPVYDAWRAVTGGEKVFTVYMSPQGKVLDQKLVRELSEKPRIVVICGHYEGLDERVIEEIVDMEISIGDFVLTGGEIPAMALIDSVARMIPGVLPDSSAYEEDSHFNGLLEHPLYTRPEEILGKRVPDILLSGHHKNIVAWKRRQSLFRTWLKRPDMLRKAPLTEEDKKFLKKLKGKRRSSFHSGVFPE
ncbi:MAG: tRNA (guanosine(37)-N1)-methyltransferase TrmD [Monoglobales bacterium]